MKQIKFIGELPSGYDWVLIQTEYIIKIIGRAYDKPTVGFILNGTELELIDIDRLKQE